MEVAEGLAECGTHLFKRIMIRPQLNQKFLEGPILGTHHHQFERVHTVVRSNRSAVVTGYRNQFSSYA
jgi:hypothetical protein